MAENALPEADLLAKDLSDTINTFTNRQRQKVLVIGLVCRPSEGSLAAIAISSNDLQQQDAVKVKLQALSGLQQGSSAVLAKLLEGAQGDSGAEGAVAEVPD